MTKEISSSAAVVLFGAIVVFFLCVLSRLFLIKRIVQSTGGAWDLNTPFRNVREERKALRILPKGSLRTQLRLTTIAALSSWLVGLGVLLTQTHK